MRTKLLSFLMLLTVAINYAQTSASVAGIAIQGIARDNNNTARVSTALNLTFRIYYGSNIEIYEISKVVNTDAFGVFSVVLEPGAANNISIANNQAYLKISEGATIISDEKLKQVPYAIAASNGVPTGSIMPYIGISAPEGWVLCDGRNLSSIPGSAALIALVGATVPNLQGMFLRGTGTSPVNSQAGPALKDTQNDGFAKHLHNATHTHTITDPGHTHMIPMRIHGNEDGSDEYTLASDQNGTINTKSQKTGITIDKFIGDTAETGTLSETRPVNYGVNYIIKL
jgi:microcystin-dependent protein